MTLYRQLVLIVALVSLLMCVGTLAVNVYSSRALLVEQLEAHARDTAGSLGLSLAAPLAARDFATMNAMIDALFDRGYYSEIRLVSIDGDLLIEREADKAVAGVPGWLPRLLPLDPPAAGGHVMDGWNLAAVVYVRSHPGHAYRQLWGMVSGTLYLFALMAAGIGLLGVLGIHALLRPLRAVEAQAEGIAAGDYRIRNALPRTRELRSVVEAMNRMTERVQRQFQEQVEVAERLRAMAYADPLTGLGNRRLFEARLAAFVEAAEGAREGALVLLAAGDLQRVNSEQGLAAGDDRIRDAARIISRHVRWPDATIARLSGGQFGLLLPGMGPEALEDLLARLADALAAVDPGQPVRLGACYCFDCDPDASGLLAAADQALREAGAADGPAWRLIRGDETDERPQPGRQAWLRRLRAALDHGGFELHAQPVCAPGPGGPVLHREVLVRLIGTEHGRWPAGSFLSLAEQAGLAPAIDRVVLMQLLEHLSREEGDTRYAVNLSAASIRDAAFLEYLHNALAGTALGGRLLFELPEWVLQADEPGLRAFRERLMRLGCGFGLDHFGRSAAGFARLASLRPDLVKLDGAYTRRVTGDDDDGFFVQTLCQVAHGLEIRTIAGCVENEAQRHALAALGVDGVQGFAVGRPVALDSLHDHERGGRGRDGCDGGQGPRAGG